jgi:hypothetical protein
MPATLWSSALTTIAAVIAIQIGYLGGNAVGVVVDAVTTTQKALDRSISVG